MAQDLFGLSDLLVINAAGEADIDVSDLLDEAPVLRLLAADYASNGTIHKYLKETGAPVVGFRAANTGRDYDHSVDTEVSINLAILDATCAVDKAIADAYIQGGAEAFIAREAKRHLKAAFSHLEKQIFNGTGNDATGFNGLTDSAALNQLSDAMVNGAGGTTALTSVWAIRSTADKADVVAIAGQNGEIVIGETVVIAIPEDLSGSPLSKTFPGYYTPITSWACLQIGGAYSVGRLANLDAGDHTLTDDLLSELLELFPASRPPTMFAMNRRSRGQLQRSRTTYSPTGAPAPLPVEYEGIPIVVTDSIGIAESQVT